MSNDKIITLLRKLQALADSSRNNSLAEAEVAAARMQQLMIAHKISMLELGEVDDGGIVELNAIGSAAKVMSWQSMLCGVLSRAHHCECLVGKGKLLIIGIESDAHAVSYLYKYLKNEMTRLGRNVLNPPHVTRRKFMNSFRIGCIDAIEERFAQQKKEAFASMPEQTQAMVRAEDTKVYAFIKDKYPFVKTKRSACPCNADGHAAGHAAGADISLNNSGGLKSPASQVKGG